MTQLYSRRCFMGPPREEWPRPPTFVGGGLRMAHVDAPHDREKEAEGEEEAAQDWFAFEFSPALQAMQEDYLRVQQTCDPNALAIFVAHLPHHVEGLLTLALVFAAHGQMDRAHDFIRRCLFVYEAAYIESFRSCFVGESLSAKAMAAHPISCRMDFRRPENRPFFSALFRHIQMLGGRGLYQTAFEVSKFLLSLDPRGDPTGILLCLDFYAIRAGKKEQLLAMAECGFPIGGGWKDKDEGEGEEGKGEGKQTEMAAEDDEDEDDLTVPLSSRASAAAGAGGAAADEEFTVKALPNFCYSCALALFLTHRRASEEARNALRDALFRFPSVLQPLVEKCRNELGSRVTQLW